MKLPGGPESSTPSTTMSDVNLNHNSVTTGGGSAAAAADPSPGPGKYLRRMGEMEKELSTLKSEVKDLKDWKKNVGEWLLENFVPGKTRYRGVSIDPLPNGGGCGSSLVQTKEEPMTELEIKEKAETQTEKAYSSPGRKVKNDDQKSKHLITKETMVNGDSNESSGSSEAFLTPSSPRNSPRKSPLRKAAKTIETEMKSQGTIKSSTKPFFIGSGTGRDVTIRIDRIDDKKKGDGTMGKAEGYRKTEQKIPTPKSKQSPSTAKCHEMDEEVEVLFDDYNGEATSPRPNTNKGATVTGTGFLNLTPQPSSEVTKGKMLTFPNPGGLLARSRPSSKPVPSPAKRNSNGQQIVQRAAPAVGIGGQVEQVPYQFEPADHTPCGVCGQVDPETHNEMVFCDSCNVCVHQVCYGVRNLPINGWKCNPCREGKNPATIQCYFCPQYGGALKPVKSPSNLNWAHVCCALWIPEVKPENPSNMEPIVNVHKIPPARWKLKCSLCKEKRGACIQCQFSHRCATAFHVTCAMKHGLEMKEVIADTGKGDHSVLQAYCKNHTYQSSKRKKKRHPSAKRTDEATPRKKGKSNEDEDNKDEN